MRTENRLTQRIDLSAIVDSRCTGCPAIIACEIGKTVLEADPVCRYLMAPIRDSDESGCKKGPKAVGKILLPRPESY